VTDAASRLRAGRGKLRHCGYTRFMKMNLRVFSLVVASACVASLVMAGDTYLPIAGSVGNFRTDVRVFNPSTTKDIEVTARFLPAGNQDNLERFGADHAVTRTIPSLQMAVFDNVVTSLFAESGLGAIYLTSPDPYFTTARIYAQTATGTLGQGYIGRSLGLLTTSGVLLQLRADSAFRTNVGAVNLQNTEAHVTWTLYDRNNHAISSKTISMPAYAVIAPTSITSGFFFDAGNADLTNAWVGFSSDSPIDAYASIVDNATTDPTFLPALDTR
jgi:hypothetical protein